MDEENPILITASYDHTIKFWSTVRPIWEPERTFKTPEDQVVNRMKISKNKKMLACACSNGLKLYDIADSANESQKAFFESPCNLTQLCYKYENDMIIATSEKGELALYDHRVNHKKLLANINQNISALALSANNADLYYGDESGNLYIFDMIADKTRITLSPTPDVGIRTIAVSPNGTLVTACNSAGWCITWGLKNSELQAKQKIQAHEDYILQSAVSDNAKYLATCSADRTIKLWNISDQGELKQHKILYGHTKWVWDCSFICDSSHIITVSTDHFLKVWNCKEGVTKKSACHHKQGIICMALNDYPSSYYQQYQQQ